MQSSFTRHHQLMFHLKLRLSNSLIVLPFFCCRIRLNSVLVLLFMHLTFSFFSTFRKLKKKEHNKTMCENEQSFRVSSIQCDKCDAEKRRMPLLCASHKPTVSPISENSFEFRFKTNDKEKLILAFTQREYTRLEIINQFKSSLNFLFVFTFCSR